MNTEPGLSDAAAEYSARQRERIRSEFGCMMWAAGVGTVLVLVAAAAGWTKVAVLFILAPLLLLVAPALYALRLSRLRAAVTQKKPGPVVEMYLGDLDESLRGEHVPEFAHSLLTAEARGRIGTAEDLRDEWRRRLRALADGALEGIWQEKSCDRCGAAVEGITIARSEGLECNRGATWRGIRCSSCDRFYCTNCAERLVEPIDEKAFNLRYESCQCGREPYPALHEWVVAPDELSFTTSRIVPHGKQDPTQATLHATSLLLFGRTGAFKPRRGTEATDKRKAFLVAQVLARHDLVQVDERWQIGDGLPDLDPQGEIAPARRWPDEAQAIGGPF